MRSGCGSPSSARSASPATATWPACGSGPCGGSGCRWPTPRGSRPGPSCTSGWRCRPATSRSAEYLDVDLDRAERRRRAIESACPALLDPALPVGIDATAAAPIVPGTPSLQQAVTSCTWRIEVAGVGRTERRRRRSTRALAADDARHPSPSARATRSPTTSGPYLPRPRPSVGPTDCRHRSSSAQLATQPRGLRPAELLAVLVDRGLVEGRVLRTHQWTCDDGARRRAPPAPEARRRRRTRRRVRHEKGTPR